MITRMWLLIGSCMKNLPNIGWDSFISADECSKLSTWQIIHWSHLSSDRWSSAIFRYKLSPSIRGDRDHCLPFKRLFLDQPLKRSQSHRKLRASPVLFVCTNMCSLVNMLWKRVGVHAHTIKTLLDINLFCEGRASMCELWFSMTICL